MSQGVKSAVIILGLLVLICAGVAIYSLMQNKTLEAQNQDLQNKVAEYQNKESELLAKAKKLEGTQQELTQRIKDKENEKEGIQRSLDEIKSKSDDLNSQITQLTQERDEFKGRVDTVSQERDAAMEKLKNQPEKIVYKDRPVPAAPAAPAIDREGSDFAMDESGAAGTAGAEGMAGDAAHAAEAAPNVTAPEGDAYWAKVLKEKAALQLEIEKIKGDLNQSMLQVADLKKQTSDFQLEIKQLTDERDEIKRKIKYGEDLANNLSIELARSRNDQRFVGERADKMKEENLALQNQIKELTSTKVALERTISKLTGDKNDMNKKLAQTENVIQGRIDEIWQIKQNLDKKISDMPKSTPGEVELPPIIVNATGQSEPAKMAKSQGGIISINETNNFVIVDLGENDGSKVGRKLSVYRGNDQIGTLEVIQVRKDISAADIKSKSTKLKVGDTVR